MINKYVFAALSIAVAIGPARLLTQVLAAKPEVSGSVQMRASAGKVLPWAVVRKLTELVEQTLGDQSARATEHRAQVSGLVAM